MSSVKDRGDKKAKESCLPKYKDMGKGIGHPGWTPFPSLGQKSTEPVVIGAPIQPASVWMMSTSSPSVGLICLINSPSG
jgi:hypothetical protein